MATNFPGAVDNFPRPNSTTNTDDPGFELDVVIDNLSDAVEALESRSRLTHPLVPGNSAVINVAGYYQNTGMAIPASNQFWGNIKPSPAYVHSVALFVGRAGLAGETIQVAVYDSSPTTGLPTTVLASASVAIDTTGDKWITVGASPNGPFVWLLVGGTSGTGTTGALGCEPRSILDNYASWRPTGISVLGELNPGFGGTFSGTWSASPSVSMGAHAWGNVPSMAVRMQ